MSFSSALGWEADEQWSFSENDDDANSPINRTDHRDGPDGGSVADDRAARRVTRRFEATHGGDATEDAGQRRTPRRGQRSARVLTSDAATPIDGDERAALLAGDYASSNTAHAAGLTPSPSRPPPRTQRRSPWHRLRRHLRRHAGWHLFLATFLTMQLVGLLVLAGGVATLRTAHTDVFLHLHPWGVASCVCGTGICVMSLALVMCLRNKSLLGAMGGVAVLILLLLLLLILIAGSLWLIWVARDVDAINRSDKSSRLTYVFAAWEAAVRETRQLAAAGAATAHLPICLYQAAHACSGFRDGCCNAQVCFDELRDFTSLEPSTANLARYGNNGGSSSSGSRSERRVPAWADLVCPICQSADEDSTGSCSTANTDGYDGAPVMCTMVLLPSALRTVIPYTCLNLVALALVGGAVACTRLIHRAVKQRRNSLSATP